MTTVFLERIGYREFYYSENEDAPREYIGSTEVPYVERYYDLN